MKRILKSLLAVFFASSLMALAPASALVTDLSNKKIEIRYSFEGADLILFGSVGKYNLDGPYDVVVLVKGPASKAVVRQKEKVAGIWMNSDQVVFPEAPGYYAVAATMPLSDIKDEELLHTYGIGFEHLHLSTTDGALGDDTISVYKDALSRGRANQGLYRQELDEVTIVGEGLFRTDVHLPSNVPVGDFDVEAFIFQNGALIAKNKISLAVGKEGFERAIYDFAHNKPFWYGITAVFISLIAGWIAGMVGTRKS